MMKPQEPAENSATGRQSWLAVVLLVLSLHFSTPCMRIVGAKGPGSSKQQKPADDDDACPELMSDDNPMPALPGMEPVSRRFDNTEDAEDDIDDEAGSEGEKQSNQVQ